MVIMSIEHLKFKKYPVLDQGFICLVDAMGDDASIYQVARVSYGKDTYDGRDTNRSDIDDGNWHPDTAPDPKQAEKNRTLIRYLMSHSHTTPFEMVEIKFMVQLPMDCWRQWIRHHTANVNEYSTRYTEATYMYQTTNPTEWRLQATDNQQDSSGFLTEWPEKWNTNDPAIKYPLQHPIDTERSNCKTSGQYLTSMEETFHDHAKQLYQERLEAGVAKEQARKDLPLSTYTCAYWKCDLHSIFNFLRLRMHSHAQYEIRMYANAMYEIVKQIVPVACEAFEDYVLNACKFSAMEMQILRQIVQHVEFEYWNDISTSGLSNTELVDFKKKVGV